MPGQMIDEARGARPRPLGDRAATTETNGGQRRIVIVAQAYPEGGGISGIIEMLVSELSRQADVHLAVGECRGTVSELLGIDPGRVHDLRLHRRLNPLVFPTSVFHAFVLTRRLVKLAKTLSPDLLIAQDAIHVGPATVLAGRISGVRTAVMDHGTLTNLYDERWPATVKAGLAPRKQRIFGIAFRANRAIRAVAWRTAVTQATAAWSVGHELTPFFALGKERAKRYRQLVPADFSPPSGDDVQAARRRFGLPVDARVVNVVTRLDAQKGLSDIATAFGELLPRYPGTVAVVAGEGHLEGEFRRWIAENGCADAMRFVGRLDRPALAALHKASDIHLYAGTLGCAVSIALLEAMKSEVVPVVSDVPSFHRELIKDSGFVFKAGDVQDLVRALDAALSLSPEGLRQRKLLVQADLAAWGDPPLSTLIADILR